jgi:hypothetical protein
MMGLKDQTIEIRTFFDIKFIIIGKKYFRIITWDLFWEIRGTDFSMEVYWIFHSFPLTTPTKNVLLNNKIGFYCDLVTFPPSLSQIVTQEC